MAAQFWEIKVNALNSFMAQCINIIDIVEVCYILNKDSVVDGSLGL